LIERHCFDRTIKELKSQLEYERLRREKLECQLDEYRAEVDQLKETLEKIQAPNFVAVVGVLNTFIFLDKQYTR
jgi:chromosome condensin MukBEF ATPase and DNA-binding subunit MukB